MDLVSYSSHLTSMNRSRSPAMAWEVRAITGMSFVSTVDIRQAHIHQDQVGVLALDHLDPFDSIYRDEGLLALSAPIFE